MLGWTEDFSVSVAKKDAGVEREKEEEEEEEKEE
jgi:hypothetical protein